MSFYQFAPGPVLGRGAGCFMTWENTFSKEELDNIVKYADQLAAAPAVINDGTKAVVNKKIRTTKTAWIELNALSGWLYDRLAAAGRSANAQSWMFDLTGFLEDFQYTIYEGKTHGHYGWHIDAGETTAPRKLSLVLQLSDPKDYSGGDLQIKVGENEITIEKKRGLITFFPSWVLHRVTPVTKGTRKTLVVWITGPRFK